MVLLLIFYLTCHKTIINSTAIWGSTESNDINNDKSKQFSDIFLEINTDYFVVDVGKSFHLYRPPSSSWLSVLLAMSRSWLLWQFQHPEKISRQQYIFIWCIIKNKNIYFRFMDIHSWGVFILCCSSLVYLLINMYIVYNKEKIINNQYISYLYKIMW